MNDKESFQGLTHYTRVDVQPGGINIQHVEHLYQADILKGLGIELEARKKNELPGGRAGAIDAGSSNSGSRDGDERGIASCILHPDDLPRILKVLHDLIDGRHGKIVALVVRCAIENGLIVRPTYAQMKAEFGDIGAKSGFNKYMNSESFTEDEKTPIRSFLNRSLS